MDVTVVGRTEPQVDTLVDGKARHQTMLVVDVRTYRTDAIGRENMIFIFHI